MFTKSESKQSGVGYLFLLVTMVLFFLSLTGVLYAVNLMQKKERLQWVCQNSVLKAQEHLIKGSKHMKSFNKAAIALERQRKFFNTLAKSPEPITKAAGVAGLIAVMVQITLLNTTREGLRAYHNGKAQWYLMKGRRRLKEIITAQAKALGKEFTYPRLRSSSKGIQLKKRRLSAFSYIYKYPIRYRHKQTTHLRIHIPGQSLVPSWHNYFKDNQNWNISCSAHPEKRRFYKWFPQIGKGSLL